MTVHVHVDLAGVPHPAGRLWARLRRGRESASFEYDERWLSDRDRFALDPALPVGPGPFHTADGRAMFGAFGDCAPDRWGRMLMRRAERRRAAKAGETPRALREIDYLLLVADEARQGALRFTLQPEGSFVASAPPTIPPLIELPRLLAAARRVTDDAESEEDLRVLLAPGSSLGSARPKASIRDRDGHLAIAKFPRRDDEIDTVRWEAVALRLAQSCGVAVAPWRVETVAGLPVLLARRFDRDGDRRIPFLSAMSMLGAADNETRSYLEIADALRQEGAAPRADIGALWRRIVVNVLISNLDDHLRNHGFLHDGADGWRLAPAYDLNPVPADIRPRLLSTMIDADDASASLERAMEVVDHFGLSPTEARAISREVADAVGRWRETAAALGIARTQIERMASAFEHAETERARGATWRRRS